MMKALQYQIQARSKKLEIEVEDGEQDDIDLKFEGLASKKSAATHGNEVEIEESRRHRINDTEEKKPNP